MGKGTPDFFGVEVHNSHGVINVDAGFKNVGAGSDETITTITGKGVIFFGNIRAFGSNNHQDDVVRCVVDGVSLSAFTFEGFLTNGYLLSEKHILNLTVLDNESYRYVCCIQPNLPFINSVEIQYSNNEADSVSVFTKIGYALVE